MFTLCRKCGGAARRNGDCYVCGAYNGRFRPAIFRPVVFEHPETEYQEKAGSPGLWCFVFGPFYLAFKGLWDRAGILFALAVVAGGFGVISNWPAVVAGTSGIGEISTIVAGLFSLAYVFLHYIYYPLMTRSLLREKYLSERGWEEVTSEYIPEEAVI